MVKKLFALASVTGLTGLVAAITAAGCSSTETVQGTPADSGVGDSKTAAKDSKPPGPEEDAEPEISCKVKDATFTATPINPPAVQSKTACSDAVINALADACLEDPASVKDTKCKDARALAANATCVACVFGTKADALWKVINIEEGKSAQFNQSGCIDHVTGVKGCGGAYITILRCANTFCPQGEGKCDQTTGTACFNEIKTGECKQYLLGNDVSSDDQACSNALQAKDPQISDNCFAADNTAAAEKTFFVNMLKTSCQTEPGAGDAG